MKQIEINVDYDLFIFAEDENGALIELHCYAELTCYREYETHETIQDMIKTPEKYL